MAEVTEISMNRKDLRNESIETVKKSLKLAAFFDLGSVPLRIHSLPFTAIIAAIAFFFGSTGTFTGTLWFLVVLNFCCVAIFAVAAVIYRKHRQYICDALKNAKISHDVSGQNMTLKFDGIAEDKTPVLVIKQVVDLAERINKDPTKIINDFHKATPMLAFIFLLALFAFVSSAVSSGTLVLMGVLLTSQAAAMPTAYVFQSNFLNAIEYLEFTLQTVDKYGVIQEQEANSR